MEVLPQLSLQSYQLIINTKEINEFYDNKLEIFSTLLALKTICVTYQAIISNYFTRDYWFNVFPGHVTYLIWLYCITMARIFVLVALVKFNWVYFIIFILLDTLFYFFNYTRSMKKMSYEDLYNFGISSFRATITYIVPFKSGDYYRFVLLQTKVFVENMLIIYVTCFLYPGSAPKWLETNLIIIVTSLYLVALCALAVTPFLRCMSKLCLLKTFQYQSVGTLIVNF